MVFLILNKSLKFKGFMLFWLSFIICTSAIVYSGTKLSKYGAVTVETIFHFISI
jgi:hypothetical protein